MTTVNLYSVLDEGILYGFDMSSPFFPIPGDAYDFTATSTTFRLYYDPQHRFYDEFTGSGFFYDSNGWPVGGQISQWNFYWNGAANMKVSGLNMPVTTYMSYFNSNDWVGFLQTALVGNDTINGSTSRDTLYGYGGNDTINAGDSYDIAKGGSGNDILTGAGGDDDLYGEDGDDTLVGGAMTDWLYGGAGSDTLSGGADVDKLFGESGNDSLDGGAGADLMEGGDGDDTYVVDDLGDQVIEADGQGNDTVKSSISFNAGAVGIERIELTGTGNNFALGNALANTIIGNAGSNQINGLDGDDVLTGNAGNDALDGGNNNDILDGGAGNDTLTGGSGDDTYVVDNVKDLVLGEDAADGTDTVKSSVSWVLGTGVEYLELTGTMAINGTGNSLSNLVRGNDAANVLNGMGGGDILIGGKGNDYYIMDGDAAVYEDAGQGVDTVEIRFSSPYILATDFENVIVGTGFSGSVLGNFVDNILTGNALDNVLNGNGGNDRLIGDKGNDTYVVDSVGDVIIESFANNVGGGVDTIESAVSWSLANLANVDNLTLLGSFNPLNGTGNALSNIITGTGGNNVLNGGAGNDTLIGGAGNDVYVVDSLGDEVNEEANKDSDDEILSSVALTKGVAGIEHYTYTGATAWTFSGTDAANKITGGSGIDTLTGGEGNDTLLGNAGNDTLSGGDDNDILDGSAGNDTMTGGDGDDTYVVDNVKDLVLGEDVADGHDTVKSSVSWVLGTGLEDLTLTGILATNGTGNAQANTITGNDGANILDGKGGADTLIGGKGNDTYIVDDAGDVIDEALSNAAGGGIDTVTSSIDIDLTGLANIDNVTLTTGAVEVTGNGANNIISGVGLVAGLTLSGAGGNDTLTGGLGNDVLAGDGGIDNLKGGKGDDTYHVDLALAAGKAILQDTLTELANEGSDTIVLHGNLALGAATTLVLGATFEHMDISQTDSTLLNVTGNALGNILTGNDADNILDGGAGNDTLTGGDGNDRLIGGAGNDTLEGGDDDDTYVIDAGDTVVEQSGEGSDTITSGVLPIALVANVENYSYTGALAWKFDGSDADNNTLSGGSGNDTLTGGEGHDTLLGNAGNDTLSGGDDNDILDGGAGNDTLNGGDGDDTYVVDNVKDLVLGEDVADGHDAVKSSISWVLGAGLEDLTLTGILATNGTGNAQANTITGNDGANILDGKGGADTLIGGKGNDTYIVDDAGDVIDEALSNVAGGGIDTVVASVDYDLTGQGNIENLTLIETGAIEGTGNLLNNAIAGNDADNKLSGAAGNDTLIGGKGNDTLDGGTGNDIMSGGLGSDTYVIDNVGDKVVETANTPDIQGFSDTVKSSINFSLASLSFVENIILTGATETENLTATGNALANSLSGNKGDNVLDGAAGNDFLFGGDGNDKLIGGVGNDSLHGGNGDDTYVIDSVGDQIFESGGQGSDTIISSLLPTGVGNVENYTYTGSAAWTFVGDDENNKLVGGSGADNLTGGKGDDWLDGGTGIDKLTGGEGNDTYVIDNLKDQILGEDSADGHDTVRSSIAWVLGTNLEDLVLTGTTAINGTGNDLNNRITGNDGANLLDGKGGEDTLIGGKGGDTYIINSAGDVVDEALSNAAGGGIDIVRTSVDFNLADDSNGVHSNIDNVVMLSGAESVTGNGLNNVITGANLIADLDLSGGGGNDTLTGGLGSDALEGGSGIDVLIGGKGNDTYHVNLMLAGAVAKLEDTATEVANEGTDTIALHGSIALISATTLTLAANIENLDASDTGSTKLNLTGNTLNNALIGNDANNILDGGVGNDTLDGGAGNDTMKGGAGNDLYVVDSLNDVVVETLTNVAGGGIDTVQSSVTFSLVALSNIDHLTLTGAGNIDGTGNAAVNFISGNDGANVLGGGQGDDTLVGGGGDDTLMGEDGNDVLNGGTGFDGIGNDNDTLNGGAGIDIVTYADAVNGIIVILDKAGPQTAGGSGVDLLVDIEGIIGGSGNDHIGGASITANLSFSGGAGDDWLDSGLGNDNLNGGTGDDELWGRQGADTLTGGTGADTFYYAAADEGGAGETITDFTKGAGGDVLDVSDLLDSVGYAGSDAFTDGYLKLATVGTDTVISFDSDGGGDDFQTFVTVKNVILVDTDLTVI